MNRFIALPRLFTVCAMLLTLGLSACGKNNNNDQNASCSTRDDCAEGQRCSAQGQCTTDAGSCEFNSDCGLDEYCANGTCDLKACSGDEDCADGAICSDAGECRSGCREDDDCPEGEACSSTNICELAGCTTDSCPNFQSCDDSVSPSECVYTGDCDNDTHCAGYAQQVDDGNEYICSQAEQRCVVKPPCESDSDCRVGDICEPRPTDGRKVCRRGCRSNDGCRSGYICDLTDLLCSPGCDTVDDCPNDGNTYACADLVCVQTCETRNECLDGQVCSGSPRRCQACRDDAECPATEFCDKTLGSTDDEIADTTLGLCAPLPPTCPDDGYGDNHNQNTAYDVTTLPFDTSSMQPLFCRENSGGEWFAITASAGDVIEVQLDYDETQGNLDVGLRREQGDEIVASQNPPTIDQGTELLRFGVDLGGTFLVHVRGTLVSANSNYDLSIDVAPPPACTDDQLEPNGAGNPAVLPEGTDYTDLEVCGSDVDIYTLAVAQNQVLTINAESPVALGNIDLYLRDPNGAQVAVAATRMDKESIEVAVEDAGNYELEVRVTSGVGNVKYDLGWRQRDNNCADQFEVNDMCPAAPIDEGSYTGLNVCSDNDWYQIDLLPLQTVTITATYDRAISAGDLDVTLIGPNDCATLAAPGTEMTIGTTTQVQETVQYQAMQGGTFNVQVFLFSGIQAEYDLDIDISDGPPCTDDSFEPNDDSAGAVAIDRTGASTGADNVITGLKMCDTDEDWYQIDLQDGDQIQFDVQFDHDRGDLDAELIGPGNVTVALSDSQNDNETVSYTVGAGEAGTYYLKVKAKFAARNDYWVLTYLNGTGPVDPLCPDELENNDTRAEAAGVASGSYGLLVCGTPSDDDWFSIPMLSGETLEIDLAFQHANGNIDLFLYDDSGSSSTVAESRTTTDDESVTFTSNRDQTVFWRVEALTNQAAMPYDMVVNKSGAGACTDDAFAGNDSSGQAAAVEIPGLYSRLRLCDGSDDWFAIDLQQGRASEVFLNFDGTKADLDVTIFNPSMAVVASGTSTDSDESVEFTPAVTGTFLVQVSGKANARLDYDLLLYTDTNGNGTPEGPADRICPDAYENNDAPLTPVQIPAGSYDNLLLCSPSDLDYYRVFVPEGATITASIDFTNADGNLDLRLLNAANQPVDESRTDNDTESVSATNNGAGANYSVSVISAGGTFSNYYSMDIGLAFADACSDDSNTGGTKATAVSTGTGAYDLTLCEGSEDWIALGSITEVDARIEFKNELGDLDIELHDTNGMIASSADSTNTESIALGGLTGNHWLRIAPKNNAFIRNNYDLWLSVNGNDPTVPYCPDEYERNDDEQTASTLTIPTSQLTQVPDLIACGVEEDWYITANLASTGPTTPYKLGVFYDHAAGSDVDVAVWPATDDPATDPPLAEVNNTNDDALADLQITSPGAHIIRVRNTGGASTPYDLLLGRSTMYTTQCPEDSLEPNNDNYIQSSGIPFGVSNALGLCGNDDWFKFTAPNNGTVTVTAAFDASQLNIGLEVRNASGSVFVSVNDDNGNRESTSFTAVAGTEYYVHVLRGLGNGPYFLRVE